MMKYFLFVGVFLFFFTGNIDVFAENANGSLEKITTSEESSFAPPPIEYIDPAIQGHEDGLRPSVLHIVNTFLTYTGLIAVIAIIYFGFVLLTSGGNDERVKKGKQGILYVSVGILVILFSYVFVNFLIHAGSAGAANSSEYTEEEEIYERIDDIQEEMDVIDDFDLNQAQQWRQDFRDLLKDLPDSLFVKVLRNHLSDGDLTLTKDTLLKNFDAFVVAQGNVEKMTEDEDGYKDATRSVSSSQKSVLSGLRTLETKLKKIPRMEADISIANDDGPVPLIVSFDGLDSEDPTNTTIPSSHYSWSYVDIDGSEKDLGTGPNKTLTLEEPGSYVLRLEVASASQQDVLPSLDFVTIRAEPAELTADFKINGEEKGSIINIPLKDAERGISFDPTISLVPEGIDVEEYVWSFSGEKQSTGSTPETVKHSFFSTGSHSVSLEITDTTGEKDNKKMNINIQSSIAVADMSSDRPMAGEIVVFNGQRSSLDNKQPTQYDWKIYKKDEGLVAEFQNKPQFSHIFYDPGEYEVQLLIGGGVTSTRPFVVQSKPPFASFLSRVDDPSSPARVTFDASKSYDPDYEEIRFHWDFDGDGNFDVRNETDPVSSYTYTKKALFQPRLTVTDVSGQSSQAVQEIRITSLFSADFSAERFAVQINQPIIFRVETNEGDTFHWNFGDGKELDTQQILQEHTYSRAGIFPVTLTARDAAGNSIVAQKKVYVGNGSSPLPLISPVSSGKKLEIIPNLCGAGKDGAEIYRYDLVSLSAEQSINTRGTTDGLRFEWDFGNNETKESLSVEKNFIQISQPGNCEKVILTARDEISGSFAVSEPMYFFVKNALPTLTDIEVKTPQSPCKAPCTVDVKARGVSDPDGQVQTYRWWTTLQGDLQKQDLHTTAKPETSITLPAWGLANKESTYLLFVEIIDNDGGRIISEDILGSPVSVRTKNGEQALYSAQFSADKTLVSVGESIQFTARAQQSGALPNEAYLWDFNGDGEFDDTTSGPTVTNTFDTVGEYSVRLTVRHQGVSDTTSQTIFISDKRQLPLADFSAVTQGLSASFRGSLSEWDTTIAENSLSYEWDFDTEVDSDGNGNTKDDIDSTEENPTYIYSETGERTVQLTVKNSAGKMHSKTEKISLGNSGATLSSSDTLIRSISLASDMPMAQLHILVRKSADNSSLPAEIIVYGFNSNGSLLSDIVNVTVEKGAGQITGAQKTMENGMMRAFFTPSSEHEKTVLRATAKSTSGLLTETIEF